MHAGSCENKRVLLPEDPIKLNDFSVEYVCRIRWEWQWRRLCCIISQCQIVFAYEQWIESMYAEMVLMLTIHNMTIADICEHFPILLCGWKVFPFNVWKCTEAMMTKHHVVQDESSKILHDIHFNTFQRIYSACILWSKHLFLRFFAHRSQFYPMNLWSKTTIWKQQNTNVNNLLHKIVFVPEYLILNNESGIWCTWRRWKFLFNAK